MMRKKKNVLVIEMKEGSHSSSSSSGGGGGESRIKNKVGDEIQRLRDGDGVDVKKRRGDGMMTKALASEVKGVSRSNNNSGEFRTKNKAGGKTQRSKDVDVKKRGGDAKKVKKVIASMKKQLKDTTTRLKLTKKGIDDDVALEVVQSLGVKMKYDVSHANFGGNRMSSKGLSAILSQFEMSRLQVLNLSGNPISDQGIKVLCGDMLPSELNLQNCSIENDGVVSLAIAMEELSCRLRRLNIRRNKVTDIGAVRIARAIERNDMLNVLNISGNALTRNGASQLARAALKSKNVMKDLILVSRDKELETELDLDKGIMMSVFEMRRALKHRNLGLKSRCENTICDLSCCDLSDEILLNLLDIIRKHNIATRLDLSGNANISEKSLVSVEKLVRNMPTLTRVIVPNNKNNNNIRGATAWNELKRIARSGDRSEAATFRSVGHRDLGNLGALYVIQCLSSSLEDKEIITHLGLHHNNIGETGCVAIANYLKKTSNTILELALYGNNRGSFWGREFESVLANNKTLLVLDLGSNGIGDSGVTFLARGLSSNRTLRELHLDFCDISRLGLNVLTDAMCTNYTITRLWLHGNRFKDEDMSRVMSYVSRNQDKERVHLANLSGLKLSEKKRRAVRVSSLHLNQRFRDLKERGIASLLHLERAFRDDDTNNGGKSIATRLGIVSARAYMKMCPNHVSSFRGDIVLSSIVAEHIPSNKLAVVSFAVGTKYLSPSIARSDCGRGEVVRDSHAEVLTRRAFCVFLYTQVAMELSKDVKSSSFRMFRCIDNNLKLCPEFRFHLYVSTAPCGGCSIPTKDITVLAKSLDASNSKGGCVAHTADRVIGNSSVRLSCTNKLVRWCFLGFQGNLLSHFIPRPIRVENVAICRKFDLTRCKRNVTDVLKRLDKTSLPCFICVPSNASVEKICNRLDTSQEKGGDGDEVIWWAASEQTPSRLDGRVGRPLRGCGTSFNCSRLSSLDMLLNFHAVSSMLTEGGSVKSSSSSSSGSSNSCVHYDEITESKKLKQCSKSLYYDEKRRELIRCWCGGSSSSSSSSRNM